MGTFEAGEIFRLPCAAVESVPAKPPSRPARRNRNYVLELSEACGHYNISLAAADLAPTDLMVYEPPDGPPSLLTRAAVEERVAVIDPTPPSYAIYHPDTCIFQYANDAAFTAGSGEAAYHERARADVNAMAFYLGVDHRGHVGNVYAGFTRACPPRTEVSVYTYGYGYWSSCFPAAPRKAAASASNRPPRAAVLEGWTHERYATYSVFRGPNGEAARSAAMMRAIAARPAELPPGFVAVRNSRNGLAQPYTIYYGPDGARHRSRPEAWAAYAAAGGNIPAPPAKRYRGRRPEHEVRR